MSDWLELARVDWVYGGQRPSVLHALGEISNDADEDWYGEGKTACGRVGQWEIPGLFSRMGVKRCDRCCDRLGFPRGVGSPKNDSHLRELLGLPA